MCPDPRNHADRRVPCPLVLPDGPQVSFKGTAHAANIKHSVYMLRSGLTNCIKLDDCITGIETPSSEEFSRCDRHYVGRVVALLEYAHAGPPSQYAGESVNVYPRSDAMAAI